MTQYRFIYEVCYYHSARWGEMAEQGWLTDHVVTDNDELIAVMVKRIPHD